MMMKCAVCCRKGQELRTLLWTHVNICKDCYMGPFFVLLPLAQEPDPFPKSPKHTVEI